MYFNNQDIYDYLQKLSDYIELQNHRIYRLEEQLTKLKKEIEQVKNTPKTTIEKIEYKFDQLKVETLEGTLNIGISPNAGDSESIEDFQVQNSQIKNSVTTEQKYEEILPQVQANLNHFFEEQIFPVIEQTEQKYETSLGEENHLIIIEDLKKQLDQRIQFYTNQIPSLVQMGDDIDLTKKITEKTINDVRMAIDNYIEQFSNKE